MVSYDFEPEDIDIAYAIDRHDQPITSPRWRRVIAAELRRILDADNTTDALNTARTIRKRCVQHGLYTRPSMKHHKFSGQRR